MINRILHLKSEIVWVVIGQVLAFVGSVVTVKILTVIMGPKSYGQLALGLTIYGFIMILIFSPVSQGILRFYSIFFDRKKLKEYFYIFEHKLKIIFSIILLVSFVIFLAVSLYIEVEWGLLVLFSILFGLFNGVNSLLVSFLTALRERKLVAFLQAGDVWLRLGGAIIMIAIINSSGYSALIGYSIGTILITILQWRSVRNQNSIMQFSRDKGLIDEEILTDEVNKYITPIRLLAIFAVITQYSDRWIIMAYDGESLVGIYAVLYTIANAPLMLLSNITSQFIMPLVFDKAGNLESPKNINNSLKTLRLASVVMTFVFISITVIAYVFGEWIVHILSTDDFSVYSSILWMLVIGISLAYLAQILSIKGMIFGKTKVYIIPRAIHAISFLIIGYWLVSKFGIQGMAIALCASSLIFFLSVVMVNIIFLRISDNRSNNIGVF